MNKNDLEKYNELHELANEFAKIIIEKKETIIVKDFFTRQSNIDEMNKRLESVQEYNDIFLKVAKRDKAKDIETLKQKIRKREELRNQNRHIKLKLASATAVAVALIAISFLVYYRPETEPTQIAAIQAIEANIEESVKIIHANGKIETLDTNKQLTINGLNIAQVEEGKIKYNHRAVDSAVMATIIIPKANRYTVVLEDGTEVYLSSNSSLKYPSKFLGESRNVELTGEASFKVMKNSKPFRVSVGGMEVQVYGTEFIINSYNRNKVKTTLLSGSVGVKYNVNDSTKEIKITPNQRLTVNSDNGTVLLEDNINQRKYISWREGFFRSDEEPLGELLEDIAHWYDIEFIFDNQSACEKLVSASLNSNMEVDSLIIMLEISTKIKIIKEGGSYRVK